MRTDRKEDLDRYYNDHLKMRIISRLMKIKSWSAIMGIQSYVIEAEVKEASFEHAEQEEFKKWKASNKSQAASTIKKTQLKDRIKIERKKL
jgi:hypothetical protein